MALLGNADIARMRRTRFRSPRATTICHHQTSILSLQVESLCRLDRHQLFPLAQSPMCSRQPDGCFDIVLDELSPDRRAGVGDWVKGRHVQDSVRYRVFTARP